MTKITNVNFTGKRNMQGGPKDVALNRKRNQIPGKPKDGLTPYT